MSEARAGNSIAAAGFAAQIDIISVILSLPEKELAKTGLIVDKQKFSTA